MVKKLLLTLSVVLIIFTCVFSATACNKKKGDIVSVKVSEGVLKKTYDVDEVIDMDRLSVEVAYENGDVENIAEDITISGFDSSTTGSKTMKIGYKNEYFIDYNYDVVYSVMPSQKIETSARVTLAQRPYLTGVSRQMDVKTGDLNNIEALYFTVVCSESIKSTDKDSGATINKYECEILLSGWNCKISEISDRSFKVIVYRAGGGLLNKDSSVLALNFFAMSGSFNAQIKDVTVTDGERDFVLPETSAV